LFRFITSDKSWNYCYDAETKPQPSQWKHPKVAETEKGETGKEQIMSMLIILFDIM
jgi:hypothetical protein